MEMAKFCHLHHNWQLQGRITFLEYCRVQDAIEKMRLELPGYQDSREFWDHAVVTESLHRDRPAVFRRFCNMRKRLTLQDRAVSAFAEAVAEHDEEWSMGF